ALVQDADGLVAVLTRHGLAREHATGGHVATDRAAVTLVLVSAVAVLRAGEVVAPHHAREAATAGDALHVDELSLLEDLVELQLLPDLEAGGVLRRAAELTQHALRLHALLLVEARERLVRVLLLAGLDAEDEGVVAVLLLRALAHH